jgi:hypothetical protein
MGNSKRTRTTIIRDNPDDDVDERGSAASREIEQDSGEQAYSEFMTKNRGVEGCRVRIRRQTPQGRQFCISEPPEAIESIEEYLAAYHSKQIWSTEEGVYFVSVDVHGETRSAFCIRIAPTAHTPALAATSGGMALGGDVNTRILERIEARLSQAEKPPMMEMVDGLAKLDQLRGGQNNGFNLDSIVKCIEIGTRMNGGGDSGGWEGLARDVLKDNAPGIIALLQMGVNKLQAMGKPAEQPKPLVAEPEKQVEESMEPSQQETMILQQAIGFLKKKAVAHSDPGLYVDLIVDNREDPLYARLISKIVENDFPAFAAIDSDIAKPEYRDFFSFIHNRIRQVFKPANTVAATGGGKGGNKGHASSNGTTGKSGGQ